MIEALKLFIAHWEKYLVAMESENQAKRAA